VCKSKTDKSVTSISSHHLSSSEKTKLGKWSEQRATCFSIISRLTYWENKIQHSFGLIFNDPGPTFFISITIIGFWLQVNCSVESGWSWSNLYICNLYIFREFLKLTNFLSRMRRWFFLIHPSYLVVPRKKSIQTPNSSNSYIFLSSVLCYDWKSCQVNSFLVPKKLKKQSLLTQLLSIQ